MDKILDAITTEGAKLGEFAQLVWGDWRGRLPMFNAGAIGYSINDASLCTSRVQACRRFARAWGQMGDVAVHHDAIVDQVIAALMASGGCVWRDWRGQLSIIQCGWGAVVAGVTYASHTEAISAFINAWEDMAAPPPEPTPEPDPIADIDILLRCAAGVSLKLSAVTSEVLALHEIIAGMVDDVEKP